MCREAQGLAYPNCRVGEIKVICPLRIGAEGTPPVGGSRGLDLVFCGACVKVCICFFIFYLFHSCLEWKSR